MKPLAFSFLILAACVFSLSAQPCLDSAKEVKPPLSKDTIALYEKKLTEARADNQRLNNSDSFIMIGRRIAYLGSYKEAIRWYSLGISKSETAGEKNPKLYRHRGHRYITIRCFDDAIRDLEAAAKLIKGKPDEIEPDGLPNAQDKPTSTLQSNIWYHLGLAYYLKGDLKLAAKAYEEAMKVSKNNDMLAATTHWYYMTLRRLEKNPQAQKLLEAINGDFEVIENEDYLKLLRLYRGEIGAGQVQADMAEKAESLSNASLGYGLGNWYLYGGDRVRAMDIFRQITAGDQWASFGFIAAEAELRRVG